jgi:hypothetical protein
MITTSDIPLPTFIYWRAAGKNIYTRLVLLYEELFFPVASNSSHLLLSFSALLYLYLRSSIQQSADLLLFHPVYFPSGWK